jgi:hypothetical protein
MGCHVICRPRPRIDAAIESELAFRETDRARPLGPGVADAGLWRFAEARVIC